MGYGIEEMVADLKISLESSMKLGLKEGMDIVKEEAIKLSDDRIYNTPLPKGGKRTGNYRKAFTVNGEGFSYELTNMMHYAVWVEYKHQKLILNDAVYNNINKVVEKIEQSI